MNDPEKLAVVLLLLVLAALFRHAQRVVREAEAEREEYDRIEATRRESEE